MTVKDIVLLVLGAILGAVVGQWYGRATGGVARRMRAGALRRRSGEGVAGSLSTKIVAYYRKSGLESSLYSPRMVGAGEPIALLFAPDLNFPRSVDIDSDSLFSWIFNCALVAHFSSSEFFKWLRTDGRLNWESASDATSSAPLEFVRLDDPRLDVWVDRQEIDPSSVFALDLARQYAADLAVPKASLSVPRGRRGSLHRPA